jgi:hypothetical protein
MGHPGAVMVLQFKNRSKVKGSGQECPLHTKNAEDGGATFADTMIAASGQCRSVLCKSVLSVAGPQDGEELDLGLAQHYHKRSDVESTFSMKGALLRMTGLVCWTAAG